MVSRENKRAAVLHEKLQLLRSITNSHAHNKTSIIVDASKYIEELKQKVETLNRDIAAAAQTSTDHQNRLPAVTVETLEKGFLIKVISDSSCPGLLVSVLEAFEDLGLNVLEARVSCTDSFRFQAVGGEGENEEDGADQGIDAQMVQQTVLQAIKNWSDQSREQE